MQHIKIAVLGPGDFVLAKINPMTKRSLPLLAGLMLGGAPYIFAADPPVLAPISKELTALQPVALLPDHDAQITFTDKAKGGTPSTFTPLPGDGRAFRVVAVARGKNNYDIEVDVRTSAAAHKGDVAIEGGIAWLPHLMWRMDKNYKALRSPTPWLKKLSSEYIREYVRLTTQLIEEPENPEHILQIFQMMDAKNTVTFSSDYPHWDFDNPKMALPPLRGELKERILWRNAAALYRFGGSAQ